MWGNTSTVTGSTSILVKLKFGMYGFKGEGKRGKPECPEKNLPEQGREPTTNSTHVRCQCQDFNALITLVGGAHTTAPSLNRHQISNKGGLKLWQQRTDIEKDKVKYWQGHGFPFKARNEGVLKISLVK